MKLTSEMLRKAFCQTQREILALSESDAAGSERFQVRWERMAELLNNQFVQETQEIIEIIKRHIATLDCYIAEGQASIREIYAAGHHTNVDPQRAAIERRQQRKFALEIVLREIAPLEESERIK